MPAPSLEKLFDMQANVEAGFAAYLSANGISAYATRSTENLPDERVIVLAEIGEAIRRGAAPTTTNTGEIEHDIFSLTLIFAVQTDRALDVSNVSGFATRHDYLCAMIRKLCLRGALTGAIGTTALSLNYYSIPFLTYQGDQYDASDEAIDTTTIRYGAHLQISADAWPL